MQENLNDTYACMEMPRVGKDGETDHEKHLKRIVSQFASNAYEQKIEIISMIRTLYTNIYKSEIDSNKATTTQIQQTTQLLNSLLKQHLNHIEEKYKQYYFQLYQNCNVLNAGLKAIETRKQNISKTDQHKRLHDQLSRAQIFAAFSISDDSKVNSKIQIQTTLTSTSTSAGRENCESKKNKQKQSTSDCGFNYHGNNNMNSITPLLNKLEGNRLQHDSQNVNCNVNCPGQYSIKRTSNCHSSYLHSMNTGLHNGNIYNNCSLNLDVFNTLNRVPLNGLNINYVNNINCNIITARRICDDENINAHVYFGKGTRLPIAVSEKVAIGNVTHHDHDRVHTSPTTVNDETERLRVCQRDIHINTRPIMSLCSASDAGIPASIPGGTAIMSSVGVGSMTTPITNHRCGMFGINTHTIGSNTVNTFNTGQYRFPNLNSNNFSNNNYIMVENVNKLNGVNGVNGNNINLMYNFGNINGSSSTDQILANVHAPQITPQILPQAFVPQAVRQQQHSTTSIETTQNSWGTSNGSSSSSSNGSTSSTSSSNTSNSNNSNNSGSNMYNSCGSNGSHVNITKTNGRETNNTGIILKLQVISEKDQIGNTLISQTRTSRGIGSVGSIASINTNVTNSNSNVNLLQLGHDQTSGVGIDVGYNNYVHDHDKQQSCLYSQIPYSQISSTVVLPSESTTIMRNNCNINGGSGSDRLDDETSILGFLNNIGEMHRKIAGNSVRLTSRCDTITLQANNAITNSGACAHVVNNGDALGIGTGVGPGAGVNVDGNDDNDSGNGDRRFVFTELISNKRLRSVIYDKYYVKQEDNSFLCKQCGKRIMTRTGAMTHVKSHLGIKKHTCRYCFKKFSGKTARDRHEMQHTGEKPYQCGICQKRFALKAGLKSHNVTHTKEKNYKCNVCDKRYTQLSSLRRHQRRAGHWIKLNTTTHIQLQPKMTNDYNIFTT